MSAGRRRAVFLDRDGVLNVYLPGDYVKRPEELVLLGEAAAGVRALNALGLPVFVISNQQGVAKGLMSAADLDRVDAALHAALAAAGARVERSYYCPHGASEACACRKPLPGLLLQAAADHDLDLAGSFFVGDTETDAQASRAAGVGHFVLVLSGKHRGEEVARDLALFPTPPDFVAPDLPVAAQWIATRLTP